MRLTIDQLSDWQDEARRVLGHKADQLKDELEQTDSYLRILDMTDELITEVNRLNDLLERKQTEIDSLSEELEQNQTRMDALRQQLLEAKEQNIKAREQSLAPKANLPPTEIHNHFEGAIDKLTINS